MHHDWININNYPHYSAKQTMGNETSKKKNSLH